jgi:hypothetical protein
MKHANRSEQVACHGGNCWKTPRKQPDGKARQEQRQILDWHDRAQRENKMTSRRCSDTSAKADDPMRLCASATRSSARPCIHPLVHLNGHLSEAPSGAMLFRTINEKHRP